MWYGGGAKDFSGVQQTPAGTRGRGPPQRSQSQTTLRNRRAGEPLQRLRAEAGGNNSQGWQRERGNAPRANGNRVLGKSQAVSAAGMLSLTASTGDFLSAETTESKELLRVGAWSVRRAPGGPEAGLLYVNVETGRAQKDPPPEVLQELDMDGDEQGEDEATSPAPRSSSSRSRPGTGRQASATGSRPGSSRDNSQPPEVSGEPARFRRILLGSGQEMPLRMARDIHAAIKEDSSFFELAQQRFSDAPKGEVPFLLDALPEELTDPAVKLAAGEISDVIGTDAGMQIIMRVC